MSTFIWYLITLEANEKKAMSERVQLAITKNEIGKISRIFNHAPFYDEKTAPFIEIYKDILSNEEKQFTQRKRSNPNANAPEVLDKASSDKISIYTKKMFHLAAEELFDNPGERIKPEIKKILGLEKVIDHFSNIAISEKSNKRDLTPEEKTAIKEEVEEKIKKQLFGAYLILIEEQVSKKASKSTDEFFKKNSPPDQPSMIPALIIIETRKKMDLLKKEGDILRGFEMAVSEILKSISDSIAEINTDDATGQEKGLIIAIENFKNALKRETDIEKRLIIIDKFKEYYGKKLTRSGGGDVESKNSPNTTFDMFKWKVGRFVANLEGMLESRAELFPSKQADDSKAESTLYSPPRNVGTIDRVKPVDKVAMVVNSVNFLSPDIIEKIRRRNRRFHISQEKNNSLVVKVLGKEGTESIGEFVIEKNKITSISRNERTYEAMLDVVRMMDFKIRVPSIDISASTPKTLLNLAKVCEIRGFGVHMRLGDKTENTVSKEVLQRMISDGDTPTIKRKS